MELVHAGPHQHFHPKIHTTSYPILFIYKKKDWSSLSKRLQRDPFSGLIDSASELLHTHDRIPTSMATVLLSKPTNTVSGV